MSDTHTMAHIWSIILNWNCPEETCACVAALRPTVAPASIIVIDNGSQDDSVALFRRRLPDVVLMPLSANYGFARAMNLGIRHAITQGATAVLLLNNDAMVAPDMVECLAQHMFATPRCGIASAKVYLSDKPGHLWAVGGRYTGRRVINLGSDEPDQGQYDAASLDYVYLCAALLRTEMVQTVGGFDEQFFMYYEDIDVSLRARAAGYSVGLVPSAHAWHHGSRSTRDAPALKHFYEARSRQLFFAKHLAWYDKPRFYAAEVRYALALSVRWLLAGKRDTALAYLRGCAAAFNPSPAVRSGEYRPGAFR